MLKDRLNIKTFKLGSMNWFASAAFQRTDLHSSLCTNLSAALQYSMKPIRSSIEFLLLLSTKDEKNGGAVEHLAGCRSRLDLCVLVGDKLWNY